jgi:hypothetical protein
LPIEPIAIDIYDLTPENTVNNNANWLCYGYLAITPRYKYIKIQK